MQEYFLGWRRLKRACFVQFRRPRAAKSGRGSTVIHPPADLDTSYRVEGVDRANWDAPDLGGIIVTGESDADPRIGQLYALSRLATYCVLADDFNAPPQLEQLVAYTAAGSAVAAADGVAATSDGVMAVLGAWCGASGLLIDADLSDTDGIRRVLSEEIRARRIQYPWIFGRRLHDAYVATHGHALDPIDHASTMSLIAQCPQGVIQLGTLVAGPFGLSVSRASRLMNQGAVGVSLMCDDVACTAVHLVRPTTGDTAAGRSFRAAVAAAGSAPQALWKQSVRSLRPASASFDLRGADDLPWLLGNGLTEDELRSVIVGLIEDRATNLRSRLAEVLPVGARDSPNSIGARLDHAQMMQAALLCTDELIVRAIERATSAGAISLSPTESRFALLRPTRPPGAFRPTAELSFLGVRFRGSAPASEQLAIAIEEVYEAAGVDLDWQLRTFDGDSTRQRLLRALDETEPADLLRRLLFVSRDTLSRAFDVFGPGIFVAPTSSLEEEQIVSRMLWKAGFRVPAPPAADQVLRSRVREFRAASDSEAADTDQRMRQTRGAGNEVYVELEAFLQRVAEFAGWALLSDHVGGVDRHERFTFSDQAGQRWSDKTLSGVERENFSWNPGRNSLGTLVSSLAVIADLCEEVMRDRSRMLRPLDQLPQFVHDNPRLAFPFRHTALIADLSQSSAERVVAALRSAWHMLANGDVVSVRNRLSHNRPDGFPTTDDVASACRAIEEAVDVLVREGLAPTTAVLVERSVRDNRPSVGTFVDGAGRTLSARSRFVRTFALPGHSVPQIVMSGAVIADTLECARFRVVTDSAWRQLWRGFGRDASAGLVDVASG